MIEILEIEKGLSDICVEDTNLYAIKGGFFGYGNLLGAAAGGAGGAIGQVGYNYSKGNPLTQGLPSAVGTNAALGFLSPVSGIASFAGGVGKAAVGAFTVPTAVDAATPYVQPYLPPSDGGSIANFGKLNNINFGF